MTRRALIARADNGGLATMTWNLARHVQFDKILVVHSDHTSRGRSRPERYEGLGEVSVCPSGPRANHAAWLTTDVDLIYSAETFYNPLILDMARGKGIKTILHAMPEMHSAHEQPDEVWIPTPWRSDCVPQENRLVPVPVDRDLLPVRVQDVNHLTIYHVHSTAMNDRNGTELLLAALPYLTFETSVKILGGEPKRAYLGLAQVEWLGSDPGLYYEAWQRTARSDVFVLPRRFGGLCLPMQEAAALGMPIVSLDLQPQRTDLSQYSLVPAELQTQVQAKGGLIDVHTCDSKRLAFRLNALASSMHTLAFLAETSNQWAKWLSWSEWEQRYCRLLSV